MKLFILCSIVFVNSFARGQTFVPDTSVNGINLNDYMSTEKVLGTKAWLHVFETKNYPFPRIEIVSRDRKQLLRLVSQYGGSKNSVDAFEILAIDKNYKLPKQVISMKVDSFNTSRNLSLFLKKSSVIKILGDKYKLLNRKGDDEVLYYEIETPSNFLKRYNAYKYHVKCTFKNNYLIKYSFGFEYP